MVVLIGLLLRVVRETLPESEAQRKIQEAGENQRSQLWDRGDNSLKADGWSEWSAAFLPSEGCLKECPITWGGACSR